MLIYRLYNRLTNKSYIGQTVQNLSDRLSAHRRIDSSCTLLNKAIKKYGWDSFSIEILLEIPKSKDISLLNRLEEEFIEVYNSQSPNGYNLLSGGMNRIPSEETRAKLSEKTRQRNLGSKLSEETKRKISESLKGRNLSEEDKERLRTMNIGREKPNGYQDKMKKLHGELKGVKVIIEDIETGDTIEFISQREASRQLCVHRSAIQKLLSGEIKLLLGRYKKKGSQK